MRRLPEDVVVKMDGAIQGGAPLGGCPLPTLGQGVPPIPRYYAHPRRALQFSADPHAGGDPNYRSRDSFRQRGPETLLLRQSTIASQSRSPSNPRGTSHCGAEFAGEYGHAVTAEVTLLRNLSRTDAQRPATPQVLTHCGEKG
jgi:hypothetical protein